MNIKDFSLKEVIKILSIYLMWTWWFYGLLFYCLYKIDEGKGLESFRMGNLPIVKFDNASYVEVAIFSGVLVVVLAIGFYLRHITYGEEVHFKRKYNIKDNRKFSDDMYDTGSDIDGD